MRYIALVLLVFPTITNAYDFELAGRIADKAKEYGNDPGISVAVLLCESGLRHQGVYGDQGRSYGIAQFFASTFRVFKMLAGKEELNYEEQDDQIELFSWALAHGYQKSWTCYSKVFKGGP